MFAILLLCYALEEGGSYRTSGLTDEGTRRICGLPPPNWILMMEVFGGMRAGRELVCVCRSYPAVRVYHRIVRRTRVQGSSDGVSLAMSIILRLISSSGMRKFMIATKRFLGSCGKEQWRSLKEGS